MYPNDPSSVHPLIETAEEACRAAGRAVSPVLRARVTEIANALAKRFGPFEIVMGMGGWVIKDNGAKMMMQEEGLDPWEVDLDCLTDWAERNCRRIDRPVLLDDEHLALLQELGDLCEWMNSNDGAAQYVEIFDLKVPTKRQRR